MKIKVKLDSHTTESTTYLSNDIDKKVGDKVNLSNSPQVDSHEVEIATFGDNGTKIIVTWWERNHTSNEPVYRISTDDGKTFEPLLNFSTDGPVSSYSSVGG